jgi:uncharacterized protein YjeT (DUF2065 family)
MSIHDLSSLLATERSRLAILLRQVAMHGWANALPAQISGIAEARSEIARLKAELHQLGEMVVDELLDQETDEERAQAATSGRGSIHIGDTVGGDKFTGDKVMGDKIINQIVLRPLPVNLWSLVQPLIDHYAADLFGGREAELAMLDSFLDDPDQPYGLLVAPTGLGKTALLIHWIARLQLQKPEWKIIFAPISIRYQTASELTILGILAHSLAEIHQDLEQFRSYDQSAQSLRALIGDYLRRPSPNDTQLLLVLDAIDEATGWEVGPLCAIAPQAGLKILISARQRADRTREDWRFHLGWNTFPVAPLDLHQLGRSAVTALLTQNNVAQANDPAFVDQFYRVSEGDPLTCNLLLKALISGEVTVESLTQRPPGLEAFLKGWVEVLRKRRKASAPIRELLALCAVAYGPLSSDDLQELAPEVFEEQGDIIDAVHDDEVARFIITVGEQQTYVFSHQRLREVFLEQIYSVKERSKLQQRLIDYGAEWYADRRQPLPDYIRQFWIAHLRAAGDWLRIRTVLTEIVRSANGKHYSQPWQTAHFVAEGSDTAYLADLDLLWSWAEQQNNIALMLRCALITSSLRSRSGNLSPELLVQLVKVGTPEGKWSPAVALEQIAHMPNSENQAACLQALLKAEITLPWQRALEIARSISKDERALALSTLTPYLPHDQQDIVLSEALQAAQNTSQERRRAQTLNTLAPHLPPKLLSEALQAALSISDQHYRVEALIALVPYLPRDQQDIALGEILQIAQNASHQRYRTQILNLIANHLPPDQQAIALNDALQAARNISDDYWHALALSILVPYLPPDQQNIVLSEALEAAQNISHHYYRAQTLSALVPYIPKLSNEALEAAQNISHQHYRAQTLSALVPYLPPKLLNEALQAALSISDQHYRAQTLSALVPYLPPKLLNEALQAALSISDQHYRAQTLSTLIPYIPRDQQAIVLGEALQSALSISDQDDRTQALSALASYLSPKVLNETLQAAQNTSNDYWRALALIALAHYFPSGQQAIVLSEALQAALSISDQHYRVQTLSALVPYLPPKLLNEALQAAQNFSHQDDRTLALSALASYLSPKVLNETLQAAQNISHQHYRALALSALTPYLPCSLLSDVLQAAQNISDDYWCTLALSAIVPYLPHDQQQLVLVDALQTVQNISDQDDRALALRTLTYYLPPDQQDIALSEALQAAQNISNQYSRTLALSALAPMFAIEPDHDQKFASTLRICSRHGRSSLLRDLAALTSWTTAIAERTQQPDVLSDLASAIIDTARCWP